MDLDRLDTLARALASAGSRRRLLALLATGPVAGGLLGLLDPAETPAKDRRRRRKQRHKRHKSPGGRKKGCQPKSRAVVCAGKCGPVKNRKTCGKRIDCGSCACTPACTACFTCQDGPNTPGACVVDPAQQRDTCGSPGQICQADGTCACEIGSCPDGAPVCLDGVCVPCTSHGQCGDATICVDGACQVCDVCQLPDVCTFTSVQAALNATPSLETIYVCPGTYIENAQLNRAVNIDHAVRLIGAGDGLDDTSNTTLRPQLTDQVVLAVIPASGRPEVTLQGLRLTGGTGLNGRGLLASSAVVQVIACTSTGNVNTTVGGMNVSGTAPEVTLINSHIVGNTGSLSGGMDVQGSGSCKLTLDPASRVTGNTATGGYGGIRALTPCVVELQSADNVTGNTSSGSIKNCGGSGSFTGPGAVCTTV